MFIGISGVAGSGKDLFVKLLTEELGRRGMKAKRYSLADALKEELKDSLISRYGIDPTNCSREDKEKIRPELVSYAKERRKETQGRHWIEKLEQKILSEEKCDAYCISDIRHSEFENDEMQWIQKEKTGKLVHITKYFIEDNAVRIQFPANQDEEINDPLLTEGADYLSSWQHGCSNPEITVKVFADWLFLNEKR
jgi:hypothetical protein